MKSLLTIFGVYLVIVLIIYGPTRQHGFVYDDHMRIELNDAIKGSPDIWRFMTDPTTQASISTLHRDTYRPLTVFNFWVDYHFWGLNAGPYHMENVAFHLVNSLLVAALAIFILRLSALGAFLGGLIFLTHPGQVETVAWIAGRSNLLALFFILIALLLWEIAMTKKTPLFLWGVYGFFSLALLARENAVVFPLLVLARHVFGPKLKSSSEPSLKGAPLNHIILLGVISIGYLILRHSVLGQMAQSPWWGGSFINNLGNAIAMIPVYFRVILWPYPLRVSYYDIHPLNLIFHPHVMWGLLIIFSLVGVMFFRRSRISYIGAVFFLFWLPTSNIIPMQALFAERFLYPLMVSVGWVFGWGVDRVWQRAKTWLSAARMALAIGLCGPLLIFTGLSRGQALIWKNDDLLWWHATRVNPRDWFAWYLLGAMQMDQAIVAQEQGDMAAAQRWAVHSENSFQTAIGLGIPPGNAGSIQHYLARVKMLQGKSQ